MSNLSAFLKKNKIIRQNTFYAVTKSLCDEAGKPLPWEIRPITTKEDERIREACTREVPIQGKAHMLRSKLDVNTYLAKLLASSVVFPDLMSVELQDSYGVKTPEDLLKEMVDDSGEYTAFTSFVQDFNGFGKDINEQADEAKN